jgi:hypothetical protein
VRRGVRRGQGHRDQEVGGREAQQHQDQDLAAPPGKDALEHGQRSLAVGALRRHPPVNRQRPEQGDQDQHDGGQRRDDPSGQEGDRRLVADGGEVVHTGQADDLPPRMARLMLADLPVRAGMTPLPPWVPHAVPCSLAIGAPYQLDIRFHRIQGGGSPGSAILEDHPPRGDNSKKRARVNPGHCAGGAGKDRGTSRRRLVPVRRCRGSAHHRRCSECRWCTPRLSEDPVARDGDAP